MKTFTKLNEPEVEIEDVEQQINDQILDPKMIDSFDPVELEIIQQYILCGDYEAAYLKIKRLPKNIATRSEAAAFFARDDIRSEVKRRKEIIVRNHTTLISQIINEYRSMAFANLDDFATWNNWAINLRPSSALTRQQIAGIVGIKNTRNGVSIQLDKRGALQDLSKILQIISDRLDLTSSDGSMTKNGTVLILPDNHRQLEDDGN